MSSIRRQLTRRLLIGTCLIAAGVLMAVYIYLRQELFEQYDKTLVARARTLGSLVRIDDDSRALEFELTERSAREFRERKLPDYFQIWDDHGGVLARSDSLDEKDLIVFSNDLAGPRHKRMIDLTLPDGRAGRAVAIVVEPGLEDVSYGEAPPRTGPHGPPVTLVLASDLAELHKTLAHVLLMLLIMFVASSAGLLAIVVGIVRRSLRPLLDIGDAAARVDPAMLATRFGSGDSPEELRPVIDKLNDLLDRVDSAIKRERRFTSNVAHELRTPIAELRSLAEVAIRWPVDEHHLVAKNFNDVLAIAQQMQAVVTALLSMARCQAGQEGLAFGAVNLEEIVTESWRHHLSTAQSRGLEVEFDVLPTIVETDRTILAAVLGNLFSNAATYTPKGGRIRCSTRTSDRSCVVEITNTNDSLTQEDIPLLTEPFWRKDAARTTSTNSGLGLALVAAYAKLLRVKFTADLQPADMFVVALEFPLAEVVGSSAATTPALTSAAAVP